MPAKFGKGVLAAYEPHDEFEDAPCPLLVKGNGFGAIVKAPGQEQVVVGIVDSCCPCQTKVAWGDCVHTFDADEPTMIPRDKMRADLVGRVFDTLEQVKEELSI